MSVVTRDAGGHDEGEGERRNATDLSILVGGVLELLCLPVEQFQEPWVLDLEVLVASSLCEIDQVDLDLVLDLVDELLKELLFRGAMRIVHGVSGYEAKDGVEHLWAISVFTLYLGWLNDTSDDRICCAYAKHP